jgi:hypothetical protein
MTLGGRIAEAIFFDKISTGAQNDLERITKLAYSMVTIYGMNEKVGHVSFHDPQGEYGYQRPYSEKTAELIDQEVRALIQKAYDVTKNLLSEAVVIETPSEETPLVVPAEDTIALPASSDNQESTTVETTETAATTSESQDSKSPTESDTEVSGEDGVDK